MFYVYSKYQYLLIRYIFDKTSFTICGNLICPAALRIGIKAYKVDFLSLQILRDWLDKASGDRWEQATCRHDASC